MANEFKYVDLAGLQAFSAKLKNYIDNGDTTNANAIAANTAAIGTKGNSAVEGAIWTEGSLYKKVGDKYVEVTDPSTLVAGETYYTDEGDDNAPDYQPVPAEKIAPADANITGNGEDADTGVWYEYRIPVTGTESTGLYKYAEDVAEAAKQAASHSKTTVVAGDTAGHINVDGEDVTVVNVNAGDLNVDSTTSVPSEKTVADAITAAKNEILGGDDIAETFDTIKEIAEWIENDESGAAALASQVAANTEAIGKKATAGSDAVLYTYEEYKALDGNDAVTEEEFAALDDAAKTKTPAVPATAATGLYKEVADIASGSVDALDATVSQTAVADGSAYANGLALSVVEENGKLTSVSGSITTATIADCEGVAPAVVA